MPPPLVPTSRSQGSDTLRAGPLHHEYRNLFPPCRHSRGEGRRESLRVRSVSELARLVSSGTIHVPKSLVHYMEDRVQLLDQIFTILSPSDVKGMLPDILKVCLQTACHVCGVLLVLSQDSYMPQSSLTIGPFSIQFPVMATQIQTTTECQSKFLFGPLNLNFYFERYAVC